MSWPKTFNWFSRYFLFPPSPPPPPPPSTSQKSATRILGPTTLGILWSSGRSRMSEIVKFQYVSRGCDKPTGSTSQVSDWQSLVYGAMPCVSVRACVRACVRVSACFSCTCVKVREVAAEESLGKFRWSCIYTHMVAGRKTSWLMHKFEYCQ